MALNVALNDALLTIYAYRMFCGPAIEWSQVTNQWIFII